MFDLSLYYICVMKNKYISSVFSLLIACYSEVQLVQFLRALVYFAHFGNNMIGYKLITYMIPCTYRMDVYLVMRKSTLDLFVLF